MIKFLAVETGSQKFGCQLAQVGGSISRFSSGAEEQEQVLQETVVFCVSKLNGLPLMKYRLAHLKQLAVSIARLGGD